MTVDFCSSHFVLPNKGGMWCRSVQDYLQRWLGNLLPKSDFDTRSVALHTQKNVSFARLLFEAYKCSLLDSAKP